MTVEAAQASVSRKAIAITIIGVVYLFYFFWFSYLYLTSTFDSTLNLLSNTYGFIPLLGGLYGLYLVPQWGGLKSAVGRAVLFLSLGLITWGIGIMIWLYYNIALGIEVPYPSLADFAFILSWPLWGIGAVHLSLATGAQFAIKEIRGRIFLVVIPIVISAFSYFVLVMVARGGAISSFDDILKVFFDLAYPIGDVVILTVAVVIFGLSYTYFGGIYKWAIFFILGAFVANYFADFAFSYTTTLETYYNGSLADVLFATTMSIFSIGIAMLDPGVRHARAYIGEAAQRVAAYDQIVARIVHQQQLIIGPLAWTEAEKVDGLATDTGRGELFVASSDPKMVVDSLVSRYERLFGGASRQVCREAAATLTSSMVAVEIPTSLR
jgi:hypothetical protein